MNPLLNAVSVSYNRIGYKINYGVGRGIGSFAYALSALLIGKVMAGLGADWMIWISLGLLGINAAMAVSYPSLVTTVSAEKKENDCCSVPVFFRRYKWYCVSLLGVMLLGMFHAMTENYLIEIVAPLGGDSGTVGVALFIATAVEAVILVYFDKVRGRISDNWLLKLAGISFVLKSVLFVAASSVATIYVIQVLQGTSYTFLVPTLMYYANNKIRPADMVKGQAFVTASYTLGCAAGNFTGGQLLSAFGIRALLLAGVAMAVAGTVVFFLTVDKKDC
jgi:PPP family 3-phenylpropionic acid transporter